MSAVENPAAFPLSPGDVTYYQEGMSLRDWFAGQALQAILMAAGIQSVLRQEEFLAKPIAQDAYAFADALLAERQKGQQP